MNLGFIERDALWHPITVHFPIVLLILAAGNALIILLPLSKKYRRELWFLLIFFIWTGTVASWIAYYTGNIAYGTEVRRICSPPLMKRHLLWATVTCYTYSAAAVLTLAEFARWRPKVHRAIIIGIVIAGVSAIFYSALLGGELVYQQGAGVRLPPPDCGG